MRRALPVRSRLSLSAPLLSVCSVFLGCPLRTLAAEPARRPLRVRAVLELFQRTNA